MFLAELLKNRSDIRKRIHKIGRELESLSVYYTPSIKYQEPTVEQVEEHEELVKEQVAQRGEDLNDGYNRWFSMCVEEATMSAVIERANIENTIEFEGDEYTLAHALAVRNRLIKVVSQVEDFGSASPQALSQGKQYTPGPDWKKYLNTYSRKIRELDNMIQKANWTIEIDMEES